MLTYTPPPPFKSAFETPFGQAVWPFLLETDTINQMEIACGLDHTPHEGIADNLKARFGDTAFTDVNKRMIGNMIRKVLEHRGWEIRRSNFRTRVACGFSTGAKYKRSEATSRQVRESIKGGAADRPRVELVTEARSLIRKLDAIVQQM